MFAPERIKLQVLDYVNYRAIKAILDLTCLEEDTYYHPADWWQAIKDRWLPRWAKRYFRVRMKEVAAIHKFPELDIPPDLFGREFVSFRVLDEKYYMPRDKEQQEEENDLSRV